MLAKWMEDATQERRKCEHIVHSGKVCEESECADAQAWEEFQELLRLAKMVVEYCNMIPLTLVGHNLLGRLADALKRVEE